ncbi:TRAP transporter large permease [Pseudooceanicola spongiae]|jgi:C4-dicarboxylate transporter, DctM subunit|uniref:TRAP transporter large permease protein n=1 Tax=Pseudooceanicola spongiae TaxID=2613965 RepID=A0A7M3V2T7_9RHOB|nr:TRAP transporter large permease [Pseudooceanicola spongiae]QOL79400.1 TRAP transporter large permease subunit [Pseudooceanicola spongiae]
MDLAIVGYVACALVILLLAIRVPIAFAIGSVAVGAIFIVFAFRTGTFQPDRAMWTTLSLAFSSSFDLVHSYDLSMIPLFIALGHIAYKAGITTEIYEAARVWLARLPGGVAIASIAGCGGFSAISGSSIACASTMGRICTPEMLRLNYDPRLATASVAAGGTLGSLIPPSVLFIIYGIFTETSISKLFLAGILPGLLSLIGYALVVVFWVKRSPEIAPVSNIVFTGKQKLRAAIGTWPAVLLFIMVVGGIYGGIFTATEAAALSLLFATLLGIARGKIRLREVVPLLRDTMVTTGAIFFIAACAKIFVALIALTGLSGSLVGLLDASDIGPLTFLLMVSLIYILLGMFLDPIGIMVLTLPLMIPMVESYDMNLIWFGVVIVKLLEIGLITPPVGLNVFVLAGVLEERKVDIGTIFAGVMRFLVSDLIVLILLIAIPAISLIIPLSM